MNDYLQLLERFDKLKQTAPDRWIACCPAHDDKSPSLHIKDAGDKLLVRCFAECSFRDIADAIGAQPSQFFAGGYDRRDFDKKHRVPWRDVVEVIRGEMWVLMTFSSALRKGQPLTDADHKRLIQAGSRIEQAWRAVHG
jgi:hypothetical protein